MFVSDFDQILQINTEIAADPNRPRLRQFRPLDPIDVELAMLEADKLVEDYMGQFRSRVSDPVMFQSFVEAYQNKFREQLRKISEWVKAYVEAYGMDSIQEAYPEDWDGKVQ